MKEYIERASVHSIIEQTSAIAFTRGGMHEKIDSLPAADVMEVRHARWIKHEGYDECEACRAKVICGYNYCPNCGARMNKEDEHEAG